MLFPVGVAAAEPTEREAYVDQAEPICKTNVLANKRIFKGAKGEVKRGELKKAARHFSRAATAFAKTIRQLDAIPKPASDEAKLSGWIDLLEDERDLIKKIGTALAAEQRNKAESYSVDLNRNSSKANNAVLPFGFDYCRIEPSRFG
ncbi:MAG TPA: hypothetical protein VHR38_07760 [Solirubrobacterales bacterium]|jgi:hypothetical protein|nr:hypothetical protein [Solirubrobacterales bacterium]